MKIERPVTYEETAGFTEQTRSLSCGKTCSWNWNGSIRYLSSTSRAFKYGTPAITQRRPRREAYRIHRHHRQVIMSHIPTLPPTETSFLARMFAQDAKNYHVWSYRQWLVRHFSIWDNELPYVESLLHSDVRNNSAWNHRWFVVFAQHTDPQKHSIKNDDADTDVPLETIEREIEYTKAAISTAPQNQSPWNYLRGVLRKKGKGLIELKGFVEQYADLEKEDEVRSSHALDFLADVYAEEEQKERSGKALELLARRYDPIRKNYWDYKRSLLGLEQVRA